MRNAPWLCAIALAACLQLAWHFWLMVLQQQQVSLQVWPHASVNSAVFRLRRRPFHAHRELVLCPVQQRATDVQKHFHADVLEVGK